MKSPLAARFFCPNELLLSRRAGIAAFVLHFPRRCALGVSWCVVCVPSFSAGHRVPPSRDVGRSRNFHQMPRNLPDTRASERCVNHRAVTLVESAPVLFSRSDYPVHTPNVFFSRGATAMKDAFQDSQRCLFVRSLVPHTTLGPGPRGTLTDTKRLPPFHALVAAPRGRTSSAPLASQERRNGHIGLEVGGGVGNLHQHSNAVPVDRDPCSKILTVWRRHHVARNGITSRRQNSQSPPSRPSS